MSYGETTKGCDGLGDFPCWPCVRAGRKELPSSSVVVSGIVPPERPQRWDGIDGCSCDPTVNAPICSPIGSFGTTAQIIAPSVIGSCAVPEKDHLPMQATPTRFRCRPVLLRRQPHRSHRRFYRQRRSRRRKKPRGR